MNKLLLLAAIVILMAPSEGKTIVVDSGGSGDYKTVDSAVAKAIPGDHIAIMPGSYRGAAIDRTLSFSGLGKVIINGQGSSALIISAPGCKISTLSFAGSAASPSILLKSSDNVLDGLFFNDGEIGAEISAINNTILNSRFDSRIGIKLGSSGFLTSNCTFKGDRGIKIEDGSSNAIMRCNFLSNTGIEISLSNENLIEMNRFSGLGFAVALSASDRNLIRGNHISGPFISGVDILEAFDNNISNNFIEGCKVGISLRQSEQNHLANNTCRRNERAGIYLSTSNSNQILKNAPSGNGNGILLSSSSNNSIISNQAEENTYGISLRGSGQNLMKHNSLKANAYNLRVDGDSQNELSRQGFLQDIDTSNTADGKPICYLVGQSDLNVSETYGFVGLIECRDVTVSNQSVSNSSSGVLLVGSTDCKVINCTVRQSEAGIALINSQSCSVDMCRAERCNVGFSAEKSSDGALRGNLAENSKDRGFKIDGSLNLTLEDSDATSCKTGMSIKNSRLCYVKNGSARQNQESGLELIGSHECMLLGFKASNNEKGIFLSGSNGCKVSGVHATLNAQDGITLDHISGVVVRGSTSSQNGQGIYVQSSRNAEIASNNLSANERHGLRMSGSSDSNITENLFINNQVSGASLIDCHGNLIYHNIFVDSGYQNAVDNGNNQWDAGAKVGGNYWSDHLVAGNPGDVPRKIESAGMDRYPFQDQGGWR